MNSRRRNSVSAIRKVKTVMLACNRLQIAISAAAAVGFLSLVLPDIAQAECESGSLPNGSYVSNTDHRVHIRCSRSAYRRAMGQGAANQGGIANSPPLPGGVGTQTAPPTQAAGQPQLTTPAGGQPAQRAGST